MVAALFRITFAIVWGFVGSRYARFGQFVRSPAAMLTYVAHVARGERCATWATTRQARP